MDASLFRRHEPLSALFSNAAGDSLCSLSAPRCLDSTNPYEAAARGPNKVVVAADTWHGNESIVRDITESIPSLAESGIRHLAVEFVRPDLDKLEALLPDLKTVQTLSEKCEIAGRYMDSYYDRIRIETFSLAESAGMSLANAEQELLSRSRPEFDVLARVEDGVRTLDFLDRLNTPHASLSFEEMARRAYLFSSVLDASYGLQTGLAYISLFLCCRENGIKIHFTGDQIGSEFLPALNEANAEQADFFRRNPRWDALSRAVYDEGMSLSYEDREGLQSFRAERDRLNDKIMGLQNSRADVRLSAQAEEKRAQRILACAGEERVLVIWGIHHFVTDSGIDTWINRRLSSQGKGGDDDNAQTQVVAVYPSRAYLAFDTSGRALCQPHLRRFVDENTTDITERGSSLYKTEEASFLEPKRNEFDRQAGSFHQNMVCAL